MVKRISCWELILHIKTCQKTRLKNSDHGDIESYIQEDLAIPETTYASQNITEEILSDKSLSFKKKKVGDISEWPLIIDSATKDEILIRGPINNEINNELRHFTNSHFQKVLSCLL